MRTISRNTGVSIDPVTKMLVDAGQVCASYYSRTVQTATVSSPRRAPRHLPRAIPDISALSVVASLPR